MTSEEPGGLGNHTRVSIREMEIDDISGVYHLGESLFTRTAAPVLYRTWDPFEVTYYYNSDPEYCLVAEGPEGEIAGFALGSTVDKDGSPWRYGYMAWLGVKKELQSKGVAWRLLREFEKRMESEGVRILLVDTEGDNQQAIDFFRRNGFNHPTSYVWLTKSLGRARRGSGRSSAPSAAGSGNGNVGTGRRRGRGRVNPVGVLGT